MNFKLKEDWISLSQVGFILASSIGFSLVAPIMIGGLADVYAFPKQILGLVTSAQAIGVAISGIVVAMVVQRYGIKKLARVGLIGLIIIEIIASFTTTPNNMLFIRLLAGLAGGLAYASSLSSFASLEKPVKGFSTYLIVFCILSAILLFSFPFFIRRFGLHAAFYVFACQAAIGFSFTYILPTKPSGARQGIDVKVFRLFKNPQILAAVVAYLALQGSAVSMFSFFERIGNEKGLSPSFIGIALSLVGFCGLLGGIIVTVFQNRLTARSSILGIAPVFLSSLVIIYLSQNPIMIMVGMFLFGTSWGFILPFYQGIQARLDSEGRIVSLGAFTNMLGQALGPALVALLLGSAAYANVSWIAMGLLIVSFSCIYIALLE